MPTAHDHYRQAEKALDFANEAEWGSDTERYHLAAAQVHATLALAAASTLDTVTKFMGDSSAVTEWGRILGVPRVPPADRIDTRTMSDPPAQGEEITDQMGGTPAVEVPLSEIFCDAHDCDEDGHADCVLLANHEPPHVDAEGREFR